MTTSTRDIARNIMTASDEELAEIFAFAMGYKNAGVDGPDSVVPDITVQKKDFERLGAFMDWLKECVAEIATSTEVVQSAWWKQEDDWDTIYTFLIHYEGKNKTPRETSFCAPTKTIAEMLFYEEFRTEYAGNISVECVYDSEDAKEYGECYGTPEQYEEVSA